MKSAPNLKKPVLTVNESTLPSLSDVEWRFLDLFVEQGRAVIVADVETMFLDLFVQQGRAVIVPEASQGVM